MDEVRFRNSVKQIGFAQIEHIMTLDPELSDGAYRTFALYLKYAHQKGACWPGISRIAKERSKTENTVSRYNSELVRLGYITRQRRTGKTTLTIIEDVDQISRLQPLIYREQQRIKNARSNLAKMQGPTLQKSNAEEESSKKKKKKKSTGEDPRPPAVDVYREETYYFPPKSWWPDLEAVEDLEFWRQVVHAYVGLGWNKRNVQGMLEWYERREIPHVAGKGGRNVQGGRRDGISAKERQAQTTDPQLAAAVRDYRARKRGADNVADNGSGNGPPG